MNAIFRRLFIDKTEHTPTQLLRYVFVGGTAAIVDIGSFMVFATLLGIDYRLAVFMSFTLGLTTNFALSNSFVFQRKSLSLKTVYVRQYLSGLLGLAVNEGVMIVLVELLGSENMLVDKVVATACAFFVNFLMVKNFAFNQRSSLFRWPRRFSR